MKIREITPEGLRCVLGACPAVYESDSGTIVLIGRRLDALAVAELLPGKVGSDEVAVEIRREFLPGLRANPKR